MILCQNLYMISNTSNAEFRDKTHILMAQRTPLLFWQGMSVAFLVVQMITLCCGLVNYDVKVKYTY